MTDYSEKAIWHGCYTSALSGAVLAAQYMNPEAIAKLCRALADAATKEALSRWPHESVPTAPR